MSYNYIAYFACFLPLVILLYQLMPQKARFVVMLVANFTFFFLISRFYVVYIILAIFFTHLCGIWLDYVKITTEGGAKAVKKKQKQVLTFGILTVLSVLVILKYTNFFGTTLSDFLGLFNCPWKYTPKSFIAPIGISFYTLQIISYLTDVYRGTQKAETNLVKTALYLSFFPTIMEGPIARFADVEPLYEGKSISYKNLKYGYQRILWGLFKKIVIADRFYCVSEYVFSNYENLDGSIILFGVIAYVANLYNEFSGCMDICIGSAEIFGISLPENFRQPFRAKTAGEFWRRWHITLGAFFKDYIFYPVSLSKPVKNLAKKVKNKFGREVSKFVAPTISLFCVWACNGLWHGAAWNFIFYGFYYFVIIFIELLLENPVKALDERITNKVGRFFWNFLRSCKMMVIIFTGELFFRAETVGKGFKMIGGIFKSFHYSEFSRNFGRMNLERADLYIALTCLIVVLIVGILHEMNIQVRDLLYKCPTPVRWIFWYTCIFVIVMFGAYGSGYSIVELIYAGY